jgi:hypothetical protein
MGGKRSSNRVRPDGLPSNNVHPQKKSHPWARKPACLTAKALKCEDFNDRKIVPPANTP